MHTTTLCLLTRNEPSRAVLLGWKKAGFGQGKYAGFGGKVAMGETIKQAAVRELEEETGLRVHESGLVETALIRFQFPTRPEWNQQVVVFMVREWHGFPVETTEMRPAWFNLDNIPFGHMWQDARDWLPRILAGETFQAHFIFNPDLESIASHHFSPLDEKTIRDILGM